MLQCTAHLTGTAVGTSAVCPCSHPVQVMCVCMCFLVGGPMGSVNSSVCSYHALSDSRTPKVACRCHNEILCLSFTRLGFTYTGAPAYDAGHGSGRDRQRAGTGTTTGIRIMPKTSTSSRANTKTRASTWKGTGARCLTFRRTVRAHPNQ